ncbi:ATP-binding protein [Streptomyces sp. TP-A0874]|uniref:ATP-binding protein n=1 Tax=Streptomyces sp. TP-A0874 TaxID=549819 RepID=UPI000852C818|nr:ATP-binding protein [Streptomyces sp. TP-A0874]
MAEPVPSGEVVLREDVLDYTPCPKSVTLARRRAARLVAEWGYPGLSGDLALVVSELAANAVQHGGVSGRLFRVELALTATVVRVAVSDARSASLPVQRPVGPEDTSGRGLLIVRMLAARWDVGKQADRKTVWCELELPERGPSSTGVNRPGVPRG